MQEISEDIARQDTPMRKAVTPNRRLTIRLFYLASTSEYRTVANLVGVSTSFLRTCIKNVCEAIVYREEWYQRFPIGDRMPPKISFRHEGHFLGGPGPPPEDRVIACQKIGIYTPKHQAGRAKSNGLRAHF